MARLELSLSSPSARLCFVVVNRGEARIDESIPLPREAHALQQRDMRHDRDGPAAGEQWTRIVEQRREEHTGAVINDELRRAEQADDVDRVTDLALLAPHVLLALGVDRQL